MLLRGSAHADVPNRRRHQRSFGTFQRTKHDFDWKLASILPPSNQLDSRPDLLRQRFCRASRSVRDQPFRESLRNNVLDLLPDEFIAAISELLLCLYVKEDDLPALVYYHHGVRRRLQKSTISALHLRQMLLRGPAYADVPN